MHVRIISTGPCPHDTKVFNSDTGEEIKGVRSITLTCDVNNPWIAKIELIPSSVEVVAISRDEKC